MFWIVAFAWVAALGALGALLFAGVLWLDVAKASPASGSYRHAAKLTGVAFVVGSVAVFVLLGASLG